MCRSNYKLTVTVSVVLIFVILNQAHTSFCDSNEVHALILARGGSKGVKLKNLVTINGATILSRVISTIQRSGVFSIVWVSTNDEKIAAEAVKYGALVHKRPHIYAQDETSSLESVKEFLSSHWTVTNFALFQCTSPFLKVKYILEAFRKFHRSDCVFSVTRTYKLRWKKIDGSVLPINFNPSQRPRRQNWSGELEENGMFYFTSRELIKQNIFQSNKCAIVEINSFDSNDLDTFGDVLLSRCVNLIKNRIPAQVLD